MLTFPRFITSLMLWLLLAIASSNVLAQADSQRSAVNPLRLSYTTGSVSFWRNGAEDWVDARLNTPIISGDALYTSPDSVLELQGEGRMFIRADDRTEVSVVNQTPDFLQIKVASGRVSLDIRSLPVAGYNIEIATPHAVFTIDRVGYYRVDVNGNVHFITRRGGAATMTQAKGQALVILPSEEIVVSEDGRAETYVAPEPNAWDRWNDERSNDLADAYSERYIAPGIAGARDLDYYGNWRTTVEYGPIWVPDAMPGNWAPYSTGRWVWDPYYQWTWIDDAPWGWVPFHYGRWVHYAGYWAWTPGPVVTVRPVYAPALVAFFGVSFGSPGFGWVALGWGEPCIPWWGYRGFVGKPWWGNWGGPRLVNHKHVDPRRSINSIQYSNSHVKDAIIATSAENFGRHRMQETAQRLPAQTKELKPMQGALPVKPEAANLVADAPRASRPPEQIISRPVVVNKRPQETRLPWQPEARPTTNDEQRYLQPPKSGVTELRRPEPGTQLGPERVRPPLPSRYEDWRPQPAPATAPAKLRESGNSSTSTNRPGGANRNGSSAGTIVEPGNGNAAKPDTGSAAEPSRPNRFESREITEPYRWRDPATRQQPMPQGEPNLRQPSRGGRDSDAPAPAQIRIVPQERSQQVPVEMPQRQQRFESAPQMEQPRGGRAELPGMPANRVYRDVNPGRSDLGRPEQRRAVQEMQDAGRASQGRQDQGRQDQGRQDQGRQDQGRPQRQ